MENTEVKEEEIPGRKLIDLVFTWSVKDVLNENLYKNQVCPSTMNRDYDMNNILI
jgi:hypothetical protein